MDTGNKLRQRKSSKEGTYASLPADGENEKEVGLARSFLIGSICLALAVAIFLLLFLVSMNSGLNLLLNILFSIVSLIGVISVGFWWKKDDSRFIDNSTFRDDLSFLYRENRVISLVILFVVFVFALSLILIAPIFVITPTITGNSLLFGIGGSLSDASIGAVSLTIIGSTCLLIAGCFLIQRVGKYFGAYIASCDPKYSIKDSFSRHGSNADLTSEQGFPPDGIAVVDAMKTVLRQEPQQQSQSQSITIASSASSTTSAISSSSLHVF